MNSRLQTDASKPLWELLAELELPLGADQNETIHAWLDRILKPLNLYEDMCHRVERSLQEAASRALNVHLEKKTRHMHLKIYLPRDRVSKGKNWSFFRVEKAEEHSEEEQIPNHAIELYLYLETQ
jgi:hypothetical protein